MVTDTAERQSSPSSGTELQSLLEIVDDAIKSDDLRRALRFADRAWRKAPLSRDVGLLYGHLLLTSNDNLAALAIFEAIAEGWSHPDLAKAIIQALLAASRDDDARATLETALNTFAANPESFPGNTARQTVRRFKDQISGWAGINTSLDIVGEVIGAGPVKRLEIIGAEGRTLDDRLIVSQDDDFTPFLIPSLTVKRQTRLTIKVNGTPLLGSGLTFPPDIRLDGRAVFEDRTISGWVNLGWAPSAPIEILATIWGKLQLRLPTTPDKSDPGKRLFTHRLPVNRLLGDRIDLAAILPDGKTEPLPDSPLLLNAAKGLEPFHVISRVLRFFRPGEGNGRAASEQLTVIIPVYKGRDETIGCINSVLATIGPEARLLLIDDATPDKDLASALDEFAKAETVTLLRNTENLGFPASINRAFSHLSGGTGDIVILNSDAMVFPGWLKRLTEAAHAAPDIGTVTPFSNTGSIASYPGGDGTDCGETEAARLDELASRINADMLIDIPTGVGFCLYIRRACLDATGSFDEVIFDKGYGEENDFCMRASARGWRHVLAANIFVRHLGGRSFGTRRQALMDRNGRILNQRHPGYDAAIQKFIAADPIHPARRNLDEARLLTHKDPFVPVISLALSGGVARFVQERIANLTEQGLTPILVQPVAGEAGRCVLRPSGGEILTDLEYDLPVEIQKIVNLFKGLKIEHVELHHFLDLDPALIEAGIQLDVPADIYIHDHSWICPRLTLLGGNGKYCGEPAIEDCETCIHINGSGLEEGLSVAALRKRSGRWLEQARNVFVSSTDIATRLQRYFHELSPQIIPWETPAIPAIRPLPELNGRARIAVIGAIGDQKGYQVLLECARHAARQDLPLEFTVIGFTEDDQPLIDTGRVFVTGRYKESEIQTLLDREDPHLAFFSSVTPEGWCYTLTHALNAGLPIAAFDLGVVAERLRGDQRAQSLLIPLSTEQDELNDRLLTFIKGIYRDSTINEESGSTDLALFQKSSDTVQPGLLLAASGHGNPQNSVNDTPFFRAPMQEPRTELTASVETLTLAKGMYLFTVRAAAPLVVGEEGDLILPAIHIGAAPGLQSEHIEFMSGRKSGTWLYDRKDLLIAKIGSGPATILLTSIRAPGMAPLSIEVQRLDNRSSGAPPEAAQQQLPRPAAPIIVPPPNQSPIMPRPNGAVAAAPGPGGKRAIRLQIVAHIQRRGDMPFTDTPWAGCIGQRLAIEAFSITPLEVLSPDQLEYKALAANGTETGWIGGGGLCGSRRQALPLIGFAIRVKPQQGMNHFDCEYSGAFVSGAVNGPFRNGAPCYVSETDHLEGIQVLISPRQDTQWQGAGNGLTYAPEPAAIEKPAERRPIGPRFSIFRETAESSEG